MGKDKNELDVPVVSVHDCRLRWEWGQTYTCFSGHTAQVSEVKLEPQLYDIWVTITVKKLQAGSPQCLYKM